MAVILAVAVLLARPEGGAMKRAVRGVYEHPAGSGVWWIHYYADEKRHREKPGGRVTLWSCTRNARRKLKLPEMVPGKVVTFGNLSAMAVEYAETYLKSIEHYKTKGPILREPFGERAAATITPQEINEWLTRHGKTPATANRYRAFMSLAYRLGMENGKVNANPARLVRLRTENNARLRFLSRDEYGKLLGIIRRDNPKQAPTFIVSVYTRMRWGEQFSLEWGQVDLKRKIIRLTKTKNGSARNVPLNAVALAALPQQREAVSHEVGGLVFPRPGPRSDCRWWFEPALREAKISEYTWHNNRHTFCSWLAIDGLCARCATDFALCATKHALRGFPGKGKAR